MSAKPTPHHNHPTKETSMTHQNNKTIVPASSGPTVIPARRNYPSALHAMLEMTPEEVNRDIARRGKTPEAILRDFEAMLLELERAHAPKLPQCSPPSLLADNFGESLARVLFFEDRVAAGIPNWTSDGGYRGTTLYDMFGKFDTTTSIVAQVSGNSMRDASIFDGDTVLVDTKAEPKDGDIVLAHLVGQGDLVKRLRIVGRDHIVLESANSEFRPIAVDDPTSLVIHGVVKARAGRLWM